MFWPRLSGPLACWRDRGMERVTLKAQLRDGIGKGPARALRRGGAVPGVVYGRGRDPRPVAVEARALSGALHTHAGLNVLIDLELGGNGGAEPTVGRGPGGPRGLLPR